jgi:cytochrome c553
MSGQRDNWAGASIGLTAVIAAVAIVIGFALLPYADASGRFQGVWDAVCSAAGLLRVAPGGAPIQQAAYPTTQVEVTPQMLLGASADSIGNGATLALRCSMCHGARGLSQANAPNLAGQYAVAIYKQLADFKTGARASAVMAPLVADLSDADMRNLAVYYAYLPRPADPHPAAAPPIVANGAPMRGIAPCGACHGTVDHKAGATWLGGQPLAYLHAQLLAFANGTRQNDIDAQMRNIAHGLTPTEIDAASQYYAVHP